MTREEAINVIKSECYVFNPLDLDESTRINTALDVAIKALEQESYIPWDRTVQDFVDKCRECGKQKWILCSERLPEKSSRYLVTRGLKACNNLWNRVYIVNYSDLMGLCKEKIWWDGDVGKSNFERYDDILAWMPLPEPHKAEMESKE